jgi:hypothetical protein
MVRRRAAAGTARVRAAGTAAAAAAALVLAGIAAAAGTAAPAPTPAPAAPAAAPVAAPAAAHAGTVVPGAAAAGAAAPAGKGPTKGPAARDPDEPVLDPGETETVAAPGMPRPMELVARATRRLRLNGRLVLDLWRGARGAPKGGTHWKLVALGKFGMGYDAVKLYVKEPALFAGTGVVYHYDRLKRHTEVFTFWPGVTGLKRLTAEDRGKIRKGTGVSSGVYGGYPAEHATLGLESCKLGPCWHVRSFPTGKEKAAGARWDVFVLKDSAVVCNAERLGAGGKSLWRYEVERVEMVDGRATERALRLVEERDGNETYVEIVEAAWDLVFEGNFFEATTFVDGGWKKRK